MLGVIVAVWLSERRWRARGGQKGTIVDIAVPAVIFGLIGGRLYHVITDWQTYFGSRAIKEPYKALFIWEGGLGIWGAIALGAVGVWLSVRKRGISMSAIADTVAPGIAFAQGIGRWGNWFNQELYGSPTTLPWGLEIDVEHGGEPGVLYHPTFLYESVWDVALGFALLFAGRRFALHHGRLFALYVAGYTLGRFWIEGLRIDPVGGVDHAVEFVGLRINQWTSIVLFVGAVVYFWATRNKEGVEVLVPPSEAGPAAAGADPGDAGAADEGASDGDTSKASDTTSSDTTSSGSDPVSSTSGSAPSDGVASDDIAPGDAVSGDAASSDAVPGDVASDDVASGGAASGGDASAKPGEPEAEAAAGESPAADEPEGEKPAGEKAGLADETPDTEVAGTKEKNSR